MRNIAPIALTIGAAALLVGCGGSASPPIGAATEPSSAAVGKNANLLYVTDSDNDVYMIALPSGRLVGKLTGLLVPTGDCVDQNENIFVDNFSGGQIRAYAHGSKSAFRVLNDSSWDPYGCSVDPTTGNLAVCNFRVSQSAASIAVYFKAKGAAHYYEDASVANFWYCAYDAAGNLFADALNYGSHNNPIFFELRKGHGTLQPVSLSPAITGDFVPPLLWDGKYLAVAGASSGVIYQYKISGRSGRRVNVVKLGDTSEVTGPFWITSGRTGQTLYAPIVRNSIESVGVYRYPAGGKRLQNLYDAPLPFAAAVSTPK